MVDKITQRVLSGEGFFRAGDGTWRLGEEPSLVDWNTREHLGPTRRFMNRLKSEVDRYYNPDRHTTNYEDIHFLASQVHDALNGEYENPAVLALFEKLDCEPELLETEPDASLKRDWSLQELAGETTDYVHDLVVSLLSQTTERLDVLPFLVDACRDLVSERVTIATLNHDTLVEQILGKNGIEFTDGFDAAIEGVRYFDPALLDYPSQSVRLLKVHGSVNWYKVRPFEDIWGTQKVAKFQTPEVDNTVGRDGRPQWREKRPMLLIGTFNEAIRYTEWFFSELFTQFQQSLKRVDTLVICGYGFGDKGMNSQIIQWIHKSNSNRIVIIHPDPGSMEEKAGRAIQRAFDYLKSEVRLQIIAKPAAEARWQELRAFV